MIRWVAILAALGLAAGAAYGQSSQSQPTLPLGQTRPMGQMMDAPMMNDGMMPFDARMAPMLEMMRMMGGANWSPAMMGQGMMGQDMESMGSMCHAQMDPQAGAPASYLEARIAFAKSELAITSAQEPAWQAYATALRGQVQPMSTHMAGMRQAMMGNAALPDRLAARVSFLEGQLDSLKAIRDVAVQLYGQLDAAQKEKADRLLPLSSCM